MQVVFKRQVGICQALSRGYNNELVERAGEKAGVKHSQSEEEKYAHQILGEKVRQKKKNTRHRSNMSPEEKRAYKEKQTTKKAERMANRQKNKHSVKNEARRIGAARQQVASTIYQEAIDNGMSHEQALAQISAPENRSRIEAAGGSHPHPQSILHAPDTPPENK